MGSELFNFIKPVLFLFLATFSMNSFCSVLEELKNVLGMSLSETELSYLTDKYSVSLKDRKFYPSEIGCLSFEHNGSERFLTFINSWFYPERIGGYTVSSDSKYMDCTFVPNLDLSPIFLGLGIEELEKSFGNIYDVGIHSTVTTKKTGLYGKRYVEFETNRVLKKVKKKKDSDEQKEIEVEVVLVASFTFSDDDLVEVYSIVQHEEPVIF